MYPMQDIDDTFFANAKFCFTAKVELNCSPQQLFEIFEDAHAWTIWAGPIQKVEWTSPKPFGIGTTRTVFMQGGLEGYEEFTAWDRGKHMAFKFVGSNKDNMHAFGEDYKVEDLGNNRCALIWIMALEPKGFSRVMLGLIKPIMAKLVQRMANQLAKYVNNNPAF
jgi:hypothetical protein